MRTFYFAPLLCCLAAPLAAQTRASYAGSAACRTCHAEIYGRWTKTRMANIVRDPREHPDAIIPDLSKPNPVYPFTKDDVAFVYGSKWKQRYFKKVGNDYYPLPVQWDVTHQTWAPYSVRAGTDWRVQYKLGETTFTHFSDGTAHKNRMQGNDFVTSQMYTHGVACFSCHDPHGTANNADLLKPANVMCLECHGPNSPNGPRGASIEAHTHHKAGSAGSECVACHMPQIAQTIGDVNVRSHSFKFLSPAKSEALKMPNSCNTCHKDKS